MLKIVDGCPVNSLREVKEDGTQIFIGNFSFGRCFHTELIDTDTVDWEHAEEKKVANEALKAGDPRLIYSIGGMCLRLLDSSWVTSLISSHV